MNVRKSSSENNIKNSKRWRRTKDQARTPIFQRLKLKLAKTFLFSKISRLSLQIKWFLVHMTIFDRGQCNLKRATKKEKITKLASEFPNPILPCTNIQHFNYQKIHKKHLKNNIEGHLPSIRLHQFRMNLLSFW